MPHEVTVFGAPWCPDTRRCKRFLGEARTDFEWSTSTRTRTPRTSCAGRVAGSWSSRWSPSGTAPPSWPDDGGACRQARPRPPDGTPLLRPRHRRRRPAGLTAALYALREGIYCLVIERAGPGGQAAMTTHVYGCRASGGGFGSRGGGEPRGAGPALRREDDPGALRELRRVDGYLVAVTDGGEEFTARSAIVATGWGTGSSACR